MSQPGAGEPRQRVAAVVWWILLAVLAVFGCIRALRGHCIDFEVYHTATHRFLAGTPLYRAADGAMPFKYAPPVAWLMLPWTVLPAPIGAALWNITSVAVLARSARWLRQRATIWRSPGTLRWFAVLSTLALGHSAALVVYYGQVDLVLLGLVLAAWLAPGRGPGALLAGAALAAAVLLKPPAGIVGVGLLAAGRWRVVAAGLALYGASWGPVLVRYGVAGSGELLLAWRELLAGTTPPWALGHNPQGLPTLLLEWVARGEPPAQQSIVIAQGLAIALFLVAVVVARPRGVAALAAYTLGAALLSPLAWRANYVLAWPAVFWALVWGATKARWLGAAVVAVTFAVGLAFAEGFWAAAMFKQAMAGLRPFAWSFIAVLAVLLYYGRGPTGSSPEPVTPTLGR